MTRKPPESMKPTATTTVMLIIAVLLITIGMCFMAFPPAHGEQKSEAQHPAINSSNKPDKTPAMQPSAEQNTATPQVTKTTTYTQPAPKTTSQGLSPQPAAPAPTVQPTKQTCPEGTYEIGYNQETGEVACHQEPSGCPFYEQTDPKGCYPPAGITCTDATYTDCKAS